mgnify:CR=1 FL=1
MFETSSNNLRRGISIMNMFGKRRNNNRNGLMLSLVGLGVGAAAYGMMRGRNNNNNNMNMNNMMDTVGRAIRQVRD